MGKLICGVDRFSSLKFPSSNANEPQQVQETTASLDIRGAPSREDSGEADMEFHDLLDAGDRMRRRWALATAVGLDPHIIGKQRAKRLHVAASRGGKESGGDLHPALLFDREARARCADVRSGACGELTACGSLAAERFGDLVEVEPKLHRSRGDGEWIQSGGHRGHQGASQFYCDMSADHVESLVGSFNIHEGTDVENIHLLRYEFPDFSRRYLPGMKMFFDTALLKKNRRILEISMEDRRVASRRIVRYEDSLDSPAIA